jgi:carbon monoxide dehydrogenase subunit G
MTDPVVERVHLRSSPETAWAILDDPEMLCRALPTCEKVEPDGPDRFRAVLATKAMFVTIRIDVAARYEEIDRPRHLRLVLDGTPRGLSGSFHVEVPVDLAATADGGADATYAVEIRVDGSLRALAGKSIEDGLRRELADTIRALDDLAAGDGASEPPATQT